MKKILSILLVLAVMISVAACGNKKDVEEKPADDIAIETGKQEETIKDEKEPSEDKKEETKKEEVKEDKKEEQKPQEKPAEKPQETPTPETASTLGKTLLLDFKAKAGAGMGAQEIAEALLTNPAIKFGGGAMPVEEGLLSGFDNAEIKGFKSGVMFAPMIGSIPFVGYIFELENAADVAGFISTLEKNANRRWNICVEADEMVTGSAGNKVFFVMCPSTLEE